MYDFFRGRVVAIDTAGRCSFEVQGVGYSLRISEQTRQAIPLDGSETVLHARLQVKEDDLQLFGFADVAERTAFDLLLGVQGVGPAIALEICSHFGCEELRRVLATRDAKRMQEVKGVGKKSAERLVLELADKVERIPGRSLQTADLSQPALPEPEDLAYRGLVALGFSAREAAQALEQLDGYSDNPEERLRAALALLRA